MASTTVAPAAKSGHARHLFALRPDNRIRMMRQRAALSLDQLAERTGFTIAQLHRFENEPGAPGLEVPSGLRRIARALGCCGADLLSDEDAPDRPRNADEAAFIARLRHGNDLQLAIVAAAFDDRSSDGQE